MRCRVALLVLVGLLAACDAEPADEPSATPEEATAGQDAAADGRVDFTVLEHTSDVTQHIADWDLDPYAIEAAGDAITRDELWQKYGFSEDAGAIDMDEQLLVVFLRPGNTCPDELVAVTRDGDEVTTAWAVPERYDSCDDIGQAWGTAATFDLDDLGTTVHVTMPTRDGDLTRTVELADRRTGSGTEPPPGEDEIAARIADSPFRSCADVEPIATIPVVDGPLSDDTDVAAVQQQRAAFALPSDEASARALIDSGTATGPGAAFTEEEQQLLIERNRMDIATYLQETYVPEHAPDSFSFSLLDQAAGGVYVVGFTDDVAVHAERLGERFGDDIRVVAAPHSRAELDAAMDRLLTDLDLVGMDLYLGVGLGDGLVVLETFDPSPEDLETIAEHIAPELTCVSNTSHGESEGGSS